MGDDGGMTTWFRTYFEDEDVWQYFEEGADGWASRQVDVRGADSRPLTAASLAEVLHLRDCPFRMKAAKFGYRLPSG